MVSPPLPFSWTRNMVKFKDEEMSHCLFRYRYIKNVHRLFVYCDGIINERKHLLGFDNEVLQSFTFSFTFTFF